MSRVVLGLDIGGANIKAATNTKECRTVPFPLWQKPHELAQELNRLREAFPTLEEFAITMTGELCDCFANKTEGVNHILTAVQNASRSFPIRVWSTQGKFLTVEEARKNPMAVAAANWHALATYAGSFVKQGVGVLLDIGSTTTDIIPLLDGEPISLGNTDSQRMQHRELVYTGVRRTPICALMPAGEVAAELFATTLDAYLLTGHIPENPADCDTADHRPATRANAHARIARLYCADANEFSEHQAQLLANQVMNIQKQIIHPALHQQILRMNDELPGALGTDRIAVLSGSGEFLAQMVLNRHQNQFTDVVSLTNNLGVELATAAPAYAVAVLAAER